MKQHGCGGAIVAIVWAAFAGCGSDSNTATGGMTMAPAAGGNSAVPSAAAGSKATAGAAPASPATSGTSAAAGSSSVSPGPAAGAAGAGTAAGSLATAGGAGKGAAGGPAAAGAQAMAGSGASAGAGVPPAAGCGTESFAAIYSSILMNPTYNCAAVPCHGRDPANAAGVGNFIMSNAASTYMQLVMKASDSSMCSGKTRIVPGDPANSLFVQKLRSANTTCGAAMPVNADEIPDTDLKRITDWVSAGACNN